MVWVLGVLSAKAKNLSSKAKTSMRWPQGSWRPRSGLEDNKTDFETYQDSFCEILEVLEMWQLWMHSNFNNPTPVLIHFNYTTHSKFKVARPIRYIFTADTLRYSVALTFDREHL